jgi:ATP-dependent Lon protease
MILEFLMGADTDTRLVTATKILVKHNSISEVSQKITSDVNESLSKQQKEFYLRQQLAAIQRELAQLQGTGDTRRFLPGPSGSKPVSELDDDTKQDADELNDMRSRIEALDKESDVRKVCVREWRRMKRTQPSSVEQGVIRSYVCCYRALLTYRSDMSPAQLEWVVSLPWPTAAGTSQSNEALVDPLFLKKAKEQLDADHFGLDKIKQRLIEYLAVVRLKHLQIQAQQRQDMNSASGSGDASAVQATLERSAPMAPLHRPQSKAVKGPILLYVRCSCRYAYADTR